MVELADPSGRVAVLVGMERPAPAAARRDEEAGYACVEERQESG